MDIQLSSNRALSPRVSVWPWEETIHLYLNLDSHTGDGGEKFVNDMSLFWVLISFFVLNFV